MALKIVKSETFGTLAVSGTMLAAAGLMGYLISTSRQQDMLAHRDEIRPVIAATQAVPPDVMRVQAYLTDKPLLMTKELAISGVAVCARDRFCYLYDSAATPSVSVQFNPYRLSAGDQQHLLDCKPSGHDCDVVLLGRVIATEMPDLTATRMIWTPLPGLDTAPLADAAPPAQRIGRSLVHWASHWTKKDASPPR